ncbi:MAG: family 20 glycosylhydrolase [Luteolibacter sp.]|nr:family 20 glycosylhydrolase [Luteolibacter sp.]
MKSFTKWPAIIGLICALHGNASSGEPERIFRGFMIDAPRGVETMDHYFKLMDFCQKTGMNSMILRLTDDQGSAYRFTSHPELNLCDGAFSTKDLTQLVEYAKTKDIELIPEIESFGHSSYITKTAKYGFLNDGPPGEEFNALCPVNDATVDLLKDLYAEVAAIFPSRYLHIGCDEVNWGAGAASKLALETKSKDQIWAEYVNKLNARVKAIGKQTVIWGDVPIHQTRAILDLLDKDIVIMDWNYWETDKAKVVENANAVLSRGFKLIGCPAVSWCGWGPRVGELQFENINAYAEAYHELRGPNNLGVILSNWVPKRYLQGSQWDTYTIAAELLRHNGNYHYMDAIPEFVTSHFGAKPDADWKMIYRTLYEKSPQATCGKNANLIFVPWAKEQDIKNLLFANQQIPNPFKQAAALAASCQDRVTKNAGDFADLRLTTEFMPYCHDRQDALFTFANSNPSDENAVGNYFKQVALEDQAMLAKLDPAWKRGRRADPPTMDKDFLWSIEIAAAYSQHLANHPAEFIALLKARGN